MRQDPRMLKPFIRLGIPSQRPLNTTEIGIRSKAGGDCLPSTIYKASINWKRINAEINRHNYAEARFVDVPLLVRSNGKRTVPASRKRK